ncbi:MAG: flagellar biosynthesis anti-sigma factor FlgM [Pseudobdellovibrio sp.]
MKITHNKVGQNLNTQDTKSEKSSETSAAGGVNKNAKASSVAPSIEGSQATKVELSSRAQDVQKIKELAKNSPDVDMDKVEKFKRLIADGQYKVDAKAIADRMVDEHMFEAGNTSTE